MLFYFSTWDLDHAMKYEITKNNTIIRNIYRVSRLLLIFQEISSSYIERRNLDKKRECQTILDVKYTFTYTCTMRCTEQTSTRKSDK